MQFNMHKLILESEPLHHEQTVSKWTNDTIWSWTLRGNYKIDSARRMLTAHRLQDYEGRQNYFIVFQEGIWYFVLI